MADIYGIGNLDRQEFFWFWALWTKSYRQSWDDNIFDQQVFLDNFISNVEPTSPPNFEETVNPTEEEEEITQYLPAEEELDRHHHIDHHVHVITHKRHIECTTDTSVSSSSTPLHIVTPPQPHVHVDHHTTVITYVEKYECSEEEEPSVEETVYTPPYVISTHTSEESYVPDVPTPSNHAHQHVNHYKHVITHKRHVECDD